MIKFAQPKVSRKSLNLIQKIFKSGVFVHGIYTENFETELKKFFNNQKYLLSTSSCTASLHLYYLSIGLKKGDEVIMSAQTHVATAHAVEICGAKPVFVDCEINTGNIDTDKIKKYINKKTVCICVTHFLGKPTNMRKVLSLCKKYKLKLVEDTALSIGSKYNGKFAGSFGDAGAFSFHPVKIITTAEGGALILKKRKDFEKIKALKSFGYDIPSPSKRKIPGNYNINYCGLNYRMNEIESAIGIYEAKNLKKKINIRKKNYHALYDKIKNCKNFKVLNTQSEKNFSSSYYALTIILNKNFKNKRNNLILNMKNLGVQTSIYYPHPVPLLNYYKKKYNYKKRNYYNACRIAYNSITFSVAPHLSHGNINRMAQVIKKVIG